MSVALAEKLHTEEEYLALERAAEHKSEYINGRICAMAGATGAHIRITGNIAGELRQKFKEAPCDVFGIELKVRVAETGMYTYPDVVAVCGEQRYLDDRQDVLLNPTLLVEVLSPSTEAYDRGEKFAHYRTIETLQEVLLVSQHRVGVEHFVRQGEQWLLTEYKRMEDVIPLASVGVHLAVKEIYFRVQFPPEPPTAPHQISAP